VVMGPAGGDLMPRARLLEFAPEVFGIINQAELRVDHELLGRAPNLRIVANMSAGVDNLDLDALRQSGVYATNVPGAFVDATADFTLGMIVALARRLVPADRYVRSGAWNGFQPGAWDGTLLKGKTLGIVGYGAIGQAVGQRAAGFGLRLLHHTRTVSGAEGYASLERLLRESDFVSLHVPLNAGSRGLINAARLAEMKPGACLINLSRGRVVDETALVAALKSGHLGGAALDVFEDEPRVHPELPGMENVVLTPHIGGGTREGRQFARDFCVRNVARVLAGERPLNALNDPVPRAGANVGARALPDNAGGRGRPVPAS